MHIYQYNIFKRETNSAGGKAKNDVSQVLFDEGIKDLYIPSKFRLIRLLQQLCGVSFLAKDSIVFVQYPAVIPPYISKLRRRISSKGKLVAIIHDLDSLRNTMKAHQELEVLNNFDILIVHNKSMQKYINDIGYQGEIIILEIFDYLHNVNRKVIESKLEKSICFAGNLDKSIFVKKLNKVKNLHFNLYGITKNPQEIESEKVKFRGKYSSEEIVFKLEGGFGLIWDGDSLETCDGVIGNYQRYNNPHKLSLYIASEKPVIVWKDAAIADFVQDNNIGLVVNNLFEIEQKINELSKEDYEEMLNNVVELKRKISKGFFTKRAVSKIINKLV